MEIIEAGKIIELILSYHTINWYIDYRDRPTVQSILNIN